MQTLAEPIRSYSLARQTDNLAYLAVFYFILLILLLWLLFQTGLFAFAWAAC